MEADAGPALGYIEAGLLRPDTARRLALAVPECVHLVCVDPEALALEGLDPEARRERTARE